MEGGYINQIRCFSCGCVLGDLYVEHKELVETGLNVQDSVRKMREEGKLENICCRVTIMSLIETHEARIPRTCIVKGIEDSF